MEFQFRLTSLAAVVLVDFFSFIGIVIGFGFPATASRVHAYWVSRVCFCLLLPAFALIFRVYLIEVA